MKRIIALLVVFTISHFSAASSSNSLKISGEISAQTCVIAINGQSRNPIVLLPTVAVSLLNEAGKTAGDTQFDVNITGCSAASADTPIRIQFISASPTAQGNLRNTLAPDSSVSIQLLDSNGTVLSFAKGIAEAKGITLTKNETGASGKLTARYYAERSGATAGAIRATAQFSISYN